MRDRDDLHPYQQKLIDFIQATPNCACFVSMGLGKTVSALTAFEDLQSTFSAARALVIAPLRVARKVWSDEIDAWAHLKDLKVVRIIGSEKQRLEALKTRADIHTINRENVSWLQDQIIEGKKQIRPWPWDLVILDESQSFKSQSSKRWKALRRLRRLFPRMIQLTGTPIPNGYGDLWAQVYLLDQGQRLGKTEKEFHERWFNEQRGDGYSNWVIKPGAAADMQRAIADIVIALRADDYLHLPEVRWNPVRVQLSADALRTYKRFEREYIAEFSGKTVSAESAGVLGQKLAQLANGSIYINDRGDFELFHDEKLDALGELLDGIDGQAIIGYAFRSDAKRIAGVLKDFCKANGKRWAYAESDADLEAFGKGKIDYLLIHPASAGHGLNDLYKAGCANAIWFGLTTNLEWFQQLNARLAGGLRMQEKGVTIHLIVADETKDDELWPLLTDKDATQDGLTRALTTARLTS